MYNWLDEVIFLLCLTIEEFLKYFIMGLVGLVVFITKLYFSTHQLCLPYYNS